MMDIVLLLFAIQGVMGAFDMLYHHELLENLPHKPDAAFELKLHGIRNFIYTIVFFSLGFLEWHGALAWCFATLLLLELLITLVDFVVEDRTRRLSASERLTHTLLTLSYGAIIAVFAPIICAWTSHATGFSPVYHGGYSWLMAFYGVGIFAWGVRDFSRGMKLMKTKTKPQYANLDNPRQKILITGGTGFIGADLSQALIDQGHELTILTRDIEAASRKIGGRATFIDALAKLHADDAFDIVINLAGEPVVQRWTKRAKHRILQSRVGITAQLTDFIARARVKPKTLINGSAIGIYNIDDQQSFDENTEPTNDPKGAFPQEVCATWEAATSKARDHGVRVCVLRIGLVLEADGGALGKMLFPFEWALGGPLGHGRQWMSWIHRDDLIDLIIHCINHQEIKGPVNATAPHPSTNREFSKALGQALHRPTLFTMPGFMVRLLLGKMGEALLLSGQRVLPKKALDAGFQFRYPQIQQALQAIVGK